MAFIKIIIVFLTLITDGSKINTSPIVDYVDVIEINHFLNDQGQVQLDQVIFLNYSPASGKYIVIAWRSIKPGFPYPYKSKNGYTLTWRDSRDGNLLRTVHSKSRTETWTDYDPETANQEYLDRNLRPELTPKPVIKNKKQKVIFGIPLP